jgi:DNA-binding NarL/FixJ family response regulator
MDQLTILLVLSSPLLRARLRTSLRRAPDVLVVGEAAAAAQGAHLARTLRPRLVLCDLPALADRAMVTLVEQLPAIHVVLVTATELPLSAPGPVRLAGQLPFTLRPEYLAARLHVIVEEDATTPLVPAVISAEVRQRYHVTGPRGPSHAARAEHPVSAVGSHTGARNKRRLSVRQARLCGILQALQENPRQYPRDPETGLVGASALEQAIALLPIVQHQAAFMMVEIQDLAGAQPDGRLLDRGRVQRVSGALRGSIRMDDLVCHVGSATWVLLLAGLEPATAQAPLERLRAALAPLFRSRSEGGLMAVISIGFWQGDLPPAEVLARCAHALHGEPPTQFPSKPEHGVAARRWVLN